MPPDLKPVDSFVEALDHARRAHPAHRHHARAPDRGSRRAWSTSLPLNGVTALHLAGGGRPVPRPARGRGRESGDRAGQRAAAKLAPSASPSSRRFCGSAGYALVAEDPSLHIRIWRRTGPDGLTGRVLRLPRWRDDPQLPRRAVRRRSWRSCPTTGASTAVRRWTWTRPSRAREAPPLPRPDASFRLIWSRSAFTAHR